MKKSFHIVIFLLISLSIYAKEEATLQLSGEAVEAFTGEAITKAKGVILDAISKDTVAIAKTENGMSRPPGGEWTKITFLKFQIPKKHAKYIIKAYAEGYDTITRDYSIDAVYAREYSKSLAGFVFYPHHEQDLEEVTVTASKVKFYMKGDTIVYNADAFKLAEGSMLDALIRQLPGVELRDGGEIYVNGKYVESLLLNGQDFFRGDKNIMLNNLGAYTVKNIQVYEKWSDKSMLAGHNFGDEEYVMDVKLKKEYMSGYFGNIEAGYGTSNRYLGRLFGMWYTSRHRLTLVGNINNLNNSRKPGQNNNFTSQNNPGDFRTQMVGLDYNVTSDDGKKWTFQGNSLFNNIRNNTVSSSYITNFLPSGDTYQIGFSESLTKGLDVSTENHFSWRQAKSAFYIDQNFAYSNNDARSQSLSGTFLSEASNLTKELLYQIYSGEVVSFSGNAINTSLTQILTSGTKLNAGGGFSSHIGFRGVPDMLSLSVSGDYTGNNYESFNQYGINYNQLDDKSNVYQYINNHPNSNWNIKASANYSYVFSNAGSASATLFYTHSNKTQDSYLYDLDRLEDAGIFGVLPNDFNSTFNNNQTFLSHETKDSQGINLNIKNTGDYSSSKYISFQIIPQLTLNNRFLDYVQGSRHDRIRKRTFDLHFVNTYILFRNAANSFKLLYERTIDLAPLNRMIDIADTRNPLNIYLGNKELKNQVTNSLWFTWDFNMLPVKPQKHKWYNILHVKYTAFENAMTSGFSLNTESGVRTYRMFNVSGNYWLSLWDVFYQAFGPKNQFDLTATTGAYFIKEHDMMATENQNFMKTGVNTWRLAETIRFGWKIGKHQIGLLGDINWRNTKGSNTGFNDFSALNGQYGVTAQLNLPGNFSISTDFFAYTRSGYTESYMNSTDLVWNARLSYNLKSNWTFMIDGFDILNQLSNITYNVNAIGRTEMHTNVLPRYVLFHIQYKFTILPKKKK